LIARKIQPRTLWDYIDAMAGTLSRLERRMVYSSRTSCSRGVHGGGWLEGGGGSAIAMLEVLGLSFDVELGLHHPFLR